MRNTNNSFCFLFACALFLMLGIQFNNAHAQSNFKPKDVQLFNTIAKLDSLTFCAFNEQKLEVLKQFFATDLEFYNDGGGMSDYQTTIKNFKGMFERNKTSKLRRELVKESLEVYPMPGFGAIELGTHRFIHTENGKEEIGIQKFVMVWQNKDNKWQITRVISLGH